MITVAMGILGLSLDPANRFSYEGYFSPLIFGFLSLLPSVITYSTKELTFNTKLNLKRRHQAETTTLLGRFQRSMATILNEFSISTIVRKVFHWVAIEILLITFADGAGLLRQGADIFFFALTVFIVYTAVNLFIWSLSQKDAVKINNSLKALQRK